MADIGKLESNHPPTPIGLFNDRIVARTVVQTAGIGDAGGEQAAL